MEKIRSLLDSLLERTFHPIRRRIFGVNNENVEFIIDNFYRLSSEQRMGVLVSGGVALVIGTLLIMALYFSALSSLDNQLSDSFEAKHRLSFLMQNYAKKMSEYEAMKQSLQKKVGGLRARAFFEGIAREKGVVVGDINETKKPIENSDLLAKEYQATNIQIRMNKISLPKLIKFVSEVERSENYFSVGDLRIRGKFGTKLYFDVETVFNGIVSL